MYAAILGKARVVETPETVYFICFFDTCSCHLGIILLRQIIRYVKHDIANDVTNRGQRGRRNVFKGEAIGRWIKDSLVVTIPSFLKR